MTLKLYVKIENNRDIILNRLQQASDKQHAVEDILNSVFSKNEAQHILKILKQKGSLINKLQIRL